MDYKIKEERHENKPACVLNWSTVNTHLSQSHINITNVITLHKHHLECDLNWSTVNTPRFSHPTQPYQPMKLTNRSNIHYTNTDLHIYFKPNTKRFFFSRLSVGKNSIKVLSAHATFSRAKLLKTKQYSHLKTVFSPGLSSSSKIFFLSPLASITSLRLA